MLRALSFVVKHWQYIRHGNQNKCILALSPAFVSGCLLFKKASCLSLSFSLPRSSLICFCHWTPNTQGLLNPYTILLEHGDDIYRKLVNYSHVMGAPSPTCRRSLTISLFSCGPGNRSLMDHGKFGQCLRCYLRRYLRRFRGGTRLCWWLEMLATAGKETSWNRTMSLCLWVLVTKEKPSSS